MGQSLCLKKAGKVDQCFFDFAVNHAQHCQVGSCVSECKRGLFQCAQFAGDGADSKSTSGGMLIYLVITHQCQLHYRARIRQQCFAVTLKLK